MKFLSLLCLVFISGGSLKAQCPNSGPTLNDFIMLWVFTDETGTADYGLNYDLCVGESVFLKNRSIRNAPDCTGNTGVSIGNNLNSGYYVVVDDQNNYFFDPIGATNNQVCASDWQAGDILEVPITTVMSGNALNLRVQHFGPGVTSPCPEARLRSGYLNSHVPQTVTATASPLTICPGEFVTLSATGSGNYQWSTGQTGSPVTTSNIYRSTNYTVYAQDANGCVSSDQVYVEVLKAPKLSLYNHYLCQNDPFPTLNAGPGGVSYEWHLNTPTGPVVSIMQQYTPNSFGTYCVVKTGLNGCTSTGCSIVAEDARLSEPVGFTVFEDPFTGNSTLNVTATMPLLSPDYAVYWQVDELDPITNTVLSSVYNPSAWWPFTTTLTFPGYTFYKHHKYRIKRGIWSKDGCLAWKQATSIVYYVGKSNEVVTHESEESTGMDANAVQRLKQNTQTLDFTIFPNPSEGIFNIQGEDEITEIQVLDLTGKRVLVESISSTTASINLSEYSSGTYFLKIRTVLGSTTKMIQLN